MKNKVCILVAILYDWAITFYNLEENDKKIANLSLIVLESEWNIFLSATT